MPIALAMRPARPTREWKQTLAEIDEHVRSMCVRTACDKRRRCKEIGVDPAYYKRHIRSRAQLVWTMRRDSELVGVACARAQDSALYLMMICAKKGPGAPGAALMSAVEAYAKKQKLRHVALRAGSADLIDYYYKRGFVRLADACTVPSRVLPLLTKDEQALRVLDKRAVDDATPKDGFWMSKCVRR